MVTAVYPSSLATWAIEAYQRFISPYKGFCCAHRAVHGRDSLLAVRQRVAKKRGVLAMFGLLRRRFTECSVAAQVLDYESRESRRPRIKQVDENHQRKIPALDGCDPVPDCDCGGMPSSACDVGDLSSAPADCAGGGGADCVSADCVGCDGF